MPHDGILFSLLQRSLQSIRALFLCMFLNTEVKAEAKEQYFERFFLDSNHGRYWDLTLIISSRHIILHLVSCSSNVYWKVAKASKAVVMLKPNADGCQVDSDCGTQIKIMYERLLYTHVYKVHTEEVFPLHHSIMSCGTDLLSSRHRLDGELRWWKSGLKK